MTTTLEMLAGQRPAEAQPPRERPRSPHRSVTVIPYDARNDKDSDKMLPYLWQRMLHDDLTDYYFPGQRDSGFPSFVRMFSGDAKAALLITDSPTKQWNDTVCGFITWTPMPLGASNAICAGFIFFQKFWDHSTTDDGARASFEYWFTKEGVNMVVGVCPSLHLTAIRYNKRIGLHEVGRLPNSHLYKGQVCDAILYAVTREQWEAK